MRSSGAVNGLDPRLGPPQFSDERLAVAKSPVDGPAIPLYGGRMDVKTVRATILAMAADVAGARAGEVGDRLGVSRQTAFRYLREMLNDGALEVGGRGPATRYRRRNYTRWRHPLDGLSETGVWSEIASECTPVKVLSSAAERVFSYSFTQMLNNAIEHSDGKTVEIVFERVGPRLAFEIIDDGMGIFEHVARKLGLPDTLDALQQISKGKTTTAPEAHTGAGLFFASRVADQFTVDSAGLVWMVDNFVQDVGVGETSARQGTRVRFEANPDHPRSLTALLETYTQDFEFTRSYVHVKLVDINVSFVSRSEARRLLRGLERFRHVTLDFKGVRMVGQGFAEEVFRVWARAHTNTTLIPVNMAEPVALMVRRGQHIEP